MRVGDANPPGEEVDHLGRAGEAASRVVFAAFGRVVVDINPGLRRAVLQFRECAAHQGHQIGRMGQVEDVVPASAAVGQVALVSEIAVRKHGHPRRHGAEHLA